MPITSHLVPRVSRLRAISLFWGLPVALTACADAPLQAPAAHLPDQLVPSASANASSVSDTIPGSWIVEFSPQVTDVRGTAAQLAQQHGGRLAFTYEAALRGFAVQNLPPQAVTALQRNPNVSRVEADRIVTAAGTQTPTASWGIDRIDQATLPLNSTYSYANDGTGVTVYILDTGIRQTHVEFGGRAVPGFTAINDGKGTTDCGGHGSHVAGTVGGTRYGVAKGVRLVAVRVLDCNGSGSYSGIIAGIDWVTKNRVLPAVANMSLGGSASSTVNAAVQNSISAGVVYAVAAGNNSANACNYSPASAPEALTVGSTWNMDGMSSFSNTGSCVDLFAPGESIRSAAVKDDTSSTLMGGTSMASPHVAGVAALFLAANPTATPAQVASAIVGGATAGVISGVPSGTANRLLYAGVAGAAAPDPTTPPPSSPPPPSTPADAPPTASFSSSCPKGNCAFDGSASADDTGIVNYSWSFGDGTPSQSGPTLVKVQHSYAGAGKFTVTLTVTDGAGQQASASATVNLKGKR